MNILVFYSQLKCFNVKFYIFECQHTFSIKHSYCPTHVCYPLARPRLKTRLFKKMMALALRERFSLIHVVQPSIN